MKLIVTILSIYVLVLTAIPCSHVAVGHSMCKMEQQNDNTDQHDSESGIDHCSPFCTCNCCATPVLTEDPIIQFSCFKYCQHNYSEYYSTFTNSFFATIWQPPQLV